MSGLATRVSFRHATPAAPNGGINVYAQTDGGSPIEQQSFYLRLIELMDAQYAADTGSANAYAVALAPAPELGSPAALPAGMVVIFKATHANTGASTLNVNSFGALTIKKLGDTTDLASGDIAANQVVVCVFDGTYFQMVSLSANAGSGVTSVTGTAPITSTGGTTPAIGITTGDGLVVSPVGSPAVETLEANIGSGLAFDTSSPKKITAPNMVGDTGSGGVHGLVPAPGAGDAAAGKFLKADGTFAVPPGTGVVPNFADGELPSGSINGSNATFTLAHTPNPATSLKLFLNGQRLTLEAGSPVVGDYSLSTSTITMANAPSSGDILVADYRY